MESGRCYLEHGHLRHAREAPWSVHGTTTDAAESSSRYSARSPPHRIPATTTRPRDIHLEQSWAPPRVTPRATASGHPCSAPWDLRRAREAPVRPCRALGTMPDAAEWNDHYFACSRPRRDLVVTALCRDICQQRRKTS